MTAFSVCAVAPAPAYAIAAATPTVLGLDSDDSAATKASELTDALRAALVARGFDKGAEMTLLELNLNMGCDGEDFQCLGSGGENLGATELVYGTLKSNGDGYILTVSLLDVSTRVLKSTVRKPIDGASLATPDATSKLGTEIIDEIWGEESPSAVPTPVSDATAEQAEEVEEEQVEEEQVEEADATNSKNWEWGRDPSPPAWKWAGIGVSAGLAAASLGTGIATSILVSGS
ncbi:MAG: hypothetical protein ACPHRO_04915, partial [Nannocystaceae bacterium]